MGFEDVHGFEFDSFGAVYSLFVVSGMFTRHSNFDRDSPVEHDQFESVSSIRFADIAASISPFPRGGPRPQFPSSEVPTVWSILGPLGGYY